MIITNFDIVGVAVDKAEADSPLVIDCNRVLPFSITFLSVQSITGWNAQIFQSDGKIDIL